MENTNAPATDTAKQYVGNVTEIKPLWGCFSVHSGIRQFYLVRVSNPQYKGSPWAVATLKDNAFKIDACWMRTEKIAFREFRSSNRDRAYFLHSVPEGVIRTLTY